ILDPDQCHNACFFSVFVRPASLLMLQGAIQLPLSMGEAYPVSKSSAAYLPFTGKICKHPLPG
ncbi:MAG TPA: hypothetical protein PLX49_02815, partial [Prolixibacteraceae bacterium]|nr:hypothetical protein [Prolixibacteraceae bacterium]